MLIGGGKIVAKPCEVTRGSLQLRRTESTINQLKVFDERAMRGRNR